MKHQVFSSESSGFWVSSEISLNQTSLKWSIIKSLPAYSNISKKCQLCLEEKFEILNYSNPNELLNKTSKLISKCRYLNKFLLSNYKSND